LLKGLLLREIVDLCYIVITQHMTQHGSPI